MAKAAPPGLTPVPPAPPPPEAPSPYIYSLGLGLGNLAFDPGRSGCPACRGFPPAIDGYAGFGGRVTSWLALGIQGQAQVEFVTGHEGRDARLGVISGYLVGQVTPVPNLQVIGGLGYGGGQYQYTVYDDQILFQTSRDVTDWLGSGGAALAAVRYELVQYRRIAIAIEARFSTVSLGAAGAARQSSLDIVGGQF
jgi:hypothetical protein